LGGIADTFPTITVIYLFAGAYTLYRLVTHWREFWSDGLTPHNQQMAGGVAFFLLVPVGVLLHECGHMVAAWSTGSQVLGLGYFLYWGYVEYIPASASPLLDWYVALTGNFVSYLLGVGSLAVSFLWKMKPIWRLVLFQLGVLELVQTLIFYPLISLDPEFFGDWDSIYSFRVPLASGITLAVHLLSLAAFILLLKRHRATDLVE
jgi:hypothetical protein